MKRLESLSNSDIVLVTRIVQKEADIDYPPFKKRACLDFLRRGGGNLVHESRRAVRRAKMEAKMEPADDELGF